MIPRILHQVWLGGSVPRVWAEVAMSWRRFHPGWAYHFWTDAESQPFVQANYPEFLGTFESYAYPIQRADVLRYLLLHQFGGLYVDMDIECLRPMDPLLAGKRALVVHEPEAHATEGGRPAYLSNAFIAAEPGHPLLDTLLQTLTREAAVAVTHRDVLEMTGPLKFNEVFRAGVYPDIAVLDSSKVFPFSRETPELRKLLEKNNDTEPLRQSFLNKGAYAIHYWANSWYNLTGEGLFNPEPHMVDGFVFFPRRDSVGHAIRNAGRNVPELAKSCLACEEAVGFNTDGFLKSRILPKRQWDRWEGRAENEGLYIKKSVLRKPRWTIFGIGR